MDIGAPTAAGSTYDQIVVSDASAKTLSLNGTKLKLLPLTGIVTGQAYTLLTTAGSNASISLASVFKNLDGSDLLEGPTYAQGAYAFTVNYDSTFVNITFSTIPEPASLGVLMAGAPMLLCRRRRRPTSSR
jgi:hypothetical protein